MKYFAKYTRGFTLIELLVVMSIISMLSSVVIASVGTVRVKARNARIVQETNQLRNQFELGWNGTSYADFGQVPRSSYGAVINIIAPNTFSNPQINTLITDILSINSGQYGGGTAGNVPTICPGDAAIPSYQVASDNHRPENGLTIYVYPECGPVTAYAIYSSLTPILISGLSFIPTAFAAGGFNPIDHNLYTGYYCIDSSGNSITASKEWIPGFSNDPPYYPEDYPEKSYPYPFPNQVVDGKCH
ncbi:MAG: type II secretion system protein [Patescibacteria group bacterium]